MITLWLWDSLSFSRTKRKSWEDASRGRPFYARNRAFFFNFFFFFYNKSSNRSFSSRFVLKLDGTSPHALSSYRFNGKHAFFAVRSLLFSFLSIFRLHDHRIDIKRMKYLSSSAFLSLDYYSYLSRFISFFLSLFLSFSHIPLLTYKHAYKHTLAHTDTQKCPTNTHSRNFSELRYLDKNITAV